MARSAGGAVGRRLGEDTGQMLTKRSGEDQPRFSDAQRYLFLPGSGQNESAENRSHRRCHGIGGLAEGSPCLGQVGAGIRRGPQLRDSLRSNLDSGSKGKGQSRGQFKQLRQQSGRFRGRSRTEKEVARIWFARRQEVKKGRGRQPCPKETQQTFCTYREGQRTADGQQRCFFESAGCSASSRAVRGSATWTSCSTAERIDEAWKTEASQKESKQQRQQQWKPLSQLQRRIPGERPEGTCESHPRVPTCRSAQVPEAFEICEKVCERNREGTWCRRQALPHHGLQQAHSFRETTKPETLSLLGLDHIGIHAKGGVQQGCVANCLGAAIDASGCDRQLVGRSLAVDPRGRPFQSKDLRRRPKLTATCDILREEHERPCPQHRDASKTHRVQGRDRRGSERCGKGKRPSGKEQGKRQREGQRPECCGGLGADEVEDGMRQGHKNLASSSVVQCLDRSWGSFGRFWKLIKSSGLNKRLGPRTPLSPTKGDKLFPSLLVTPEYVGKSKSARSRARRRDRDEAWEYTEMVWAFFTFLDGGSPHSASDQKRLLSKAAHASWTSLHSSYAGSMHDQIKRFVRLQCDDSPLSRGISKISELVKVVKNSSYSHSPSVEKLCRTAKNVVPGRMSLPTEAGIIDPRRFLKGEHLQAFEQMPEEVPHNIEPPKRTMGRFKVDPQDLHEVNLKLLRSGVAKLIPEELGLRDKEGNVITGGLFAVDHKEESDRVILDRRPFNELERRLVWAHLPHGSLLTQIIVPPGFSVRGSGDDLSNYFYLLKHHDGWLPRNTIGHVFDGKGYEEFGGQPGKGYLLSFRVIAMGDLNAVDIAQQVHFEVLRDAQCMQPGECLEFKKPLPASHTLEGLYIDDHIVTQILPAKKNRRKGQKFRD